MEVANGHTTQIPATNTRSADENLNVTVYAESDDGTIFLWVVRRSEISCTGAN